MKGLQCKHLDTRKALEFLEEHRGEWVTWWEPMAMPSLSEVFPEAPPKLVLAKAAQLIGKGYVAGCPCGCRGDFRITDKGTALLKRLRSET